MPQNAYFTFDVETDWGGRLAPEPDNCRGISEGLPWLLPVLARYEVKATFFISGEVATVFPEVMKAIDQAGHELAVHAFSHRLSHETLSVDRLAEDIERGKQAVAKVASQPPVGYRSPRFRVNPALFRILKEKGFLYDSSLCQSRFSGTNHRRVETEEGMQLFPILPWSVLGLPPGLLWVHRFGWQRFVRGVRGNEMVFYAHPFDWIPKTGDRGFSWMVNAWYTTASSAGVKRTLENILDAMKSQGYQFFRLRDRLDQARIF